MFQKQNKFIFSKEVSACKYIPMTNQEDPEEHGFNLSLHLEEEIDVEETYWKSYGICSSIIR